MRDALVGAAPGALNTLSELADALGDDPNFAATVNAAIAARATTAQFNALSGRVLDLEGTSIEQAILYDSAADGGLALTMDDAGTLVQLAGDVRDWRLLEVSRPSE